MFCIKCGAALTNEDQFCKNCGAKSVSENSNNIELNNNNDSNNSSSVFNEPAITMTPIESNNFNDNNMSNSMNNSSNINRNSNMNNNDNINRNNMSNNGNMNRNNMSNNGNMNRNNMSNNGNMNRNNMSNNGNMNRNNMSNNGNMNRNRNMNSKNKTNNNALVIGGVVAVIVVVFLVGFMSGHIFKNDKDNDNKINATPVSNSTTFKVSYGGFTLEIPDTMYYSFEEGYLLIGDLDDSYIIQLLIADGSFESGKSKMSELKARFEKSGYVVKNIEIKKKGGVEFITLDLSNSGRNAIYAYTKASQLNTFGMAIYSIDNDFNYDALEDIAPVLGSAVYSDTSMSIKPSMDFNDINLIKDLDK